MCLGAVLGSVLLMAVSSASAQDAGCPGVPDVGPLEVTPAVGAAAAPRNAIVRVRYSPGYFAGASAPTETITLARSGGGAVPGSLQLAGDDTLYFVPSAPLDPSTQYVGSASGSAFPFDFSFTTGTVSDVARPDLRDPYETDAFDVQTSPADTACSASGSRRVGLRFLSATDDGPESSLEYHVYLTRGEDLEAPVLLTRVRDYGSDITTVGFVLGPEQIKGAVCVSVVAVDGLDRATEWSEPACFDPIHGSGFVSLCSTSPGGASASPAVAVFGAALGLLLRRGRARRRSLALTRARHS